VSTAEPKQTGAWHKRLYNALLGKKSEMETFLAAFREVIA
jgi:hypothetical protein